MDSKLTTVFSESDDATLLSPAPSAILVWIVNRPWHLDLNRGSIAKYLTHLAHDTTAKAKTILSETDQVADELGLDDELLDGLGS